MPTKPHNTGFYIYKIAFGNVSQIDRNYFLGNSLHLMYTAAFSQADLELHLLTDAGTTIPAKP